ncbi:MAG: TonB-dependent siderophore receptor [Verrucomicrobiota bacterium]
MAQKKRNQTKLNKSAAALTALIMAHGLATHSAAQSTNKPPAASKSTNVTTRLPEVVVRGSQEKEPYKPETLSSPKYTEPLRDVPQTVTVIPQAVMAEQGATTLRDVLRNVPGISIQAGEGGVPAGDNLSIRGFNARTDMFIDGVRDFGGYSRDPFNLEQVEVAKGPASSYAGRGSTGGSVNLVSKTPRLDPLYAGSAGVGTDNYKRFTLDLNQPIKAIDNAALRFNALWHDADTAGRDEVTNHRWGIAPSLAFGLETPTRVTLGYFRLDQDNVPDYGIPWVPAGNTNAVLSSYIDQAPPVDFDNFYGLTSRDYERTVTDVATARVEHDFTDSLTLRNQLRYGRNKRDSVITAPRFADLDAGTPGTQSNTTINRQLQSRDMLDTVLANQLDLTSHFDTGPVGHSLVTGAEIARETSVNHARTATAAPTTDIFNPNPTDAPGGPLARTGARTASESDSAAVYAFDTLKFSEQWQLNGGLRWDHFHLDYKSVAPSGAVTRLARTDQMLSWRAGLVYKPRENGSIYFGYGTSFNPSAEGLTLSTTATAANNINTAPEESRSFELGAKWDFYEDRLSLSLALFRTEKTNSRTQDPADSSDVVVLEGEQAVQGVELGAAGSITRDWRVFGGYTFLHSEITSTKNPAELGKETSNTPRHSFSLWTTYQLPWNFEIGGGAQYVGSRFSNSTNTRRAPGYALFDAMLGYKLNENTSLRLNVYNLADEDYIDRVGGGHFIPGAGRSAVLSANFQF